MVYRSLIDGQPAAPFIAEAMERLGPLAERQPVDPAVLTFYKGKVPDIMLDIWENYGIGDLADGRLRLCVPRSLQDAVDGLFLGDPYLGEDSYLLAYGAFGDLVLWNSRYQIVLVKMQLSLVAAPALTQPAQAGPPDKVVLERLLGLTPAALDNFDADKQPMFERARDALGPLPPLALYGKHETAFGQRESVDNLAIFDAEDWLVERAASHVFTLADPPARRLNIRRIGPLAPGETLRPAGEL